MLVAELTDTKLTIRVGTVADGSYRSVLAPLLGTSVVLAAAKCNPWRSVMEFVLSLLAAGDKADVRDVHVPNAAAAKRARRRTARYPLVLVHS